MFWFCFRPAKLIFSFALLMGLVLPVCSEAKSTKKELIGCWRWEVSKQKISIVSGEAYTWVTFNEFCFFHKNELERTYAEETGEIGRSYGSWKLSGSKLLLIYDDDAEIRCDFELIDSRLKLKNCPIHKEYTKYK